MSTIDPSVFGKSNRVEDLIQQFTNAATDIDGKADTAHTHTPDQVGLGNVDNTSDADKPVSTLTQQATEPIPLSGGMKHSTPLRAGL